MKHVKLAMLTVAWAAVVYIAMMLVFGYGVALAQPGPEINPGDATKGLIDAISSSQWTLVIGCAVMLVTWALRIFAWPNVNTKALPWIAVAIAVLGTFSVALVTDPEKWVTAVIAGVQAGIGAAGTYGLLPSSVKDKTKKKASEMAARRNG